MNTVIAEKAVIGIMLAFPDMQADAFKSLSAKMFELRELGNLFLLCKDLYEKGQQADAVSVVAKCDDGLKQLAVECAQTFPSVSGYHTYLNCVMDGWRRRDMRAKMTELLSREQDADTMAANLILMAEKQQRIMHHQKEQSAKTFAEGISDFMAWLKKPADNLKTGFSRFDGVTGGLARCGVTVIAARPGKGKSTLALQMAAQISSSTLVLYQSMEMPRQQLYAKIYARWLQMDSKKIENRELTPEEWREIEQAGEVLKQRYRLILDDSPLTSLADVEENIKNHKPEAVVIDYLNLLSSSGTRDKRNEELAELTRGLKRLALKYRIFIIELVQASRGSEGKKITMADMFGSATIEQDADMILAVNPQDGAESVPVDVDVIKNRHGPTGSFPFIWVKPFHQFCEVMEHG